MRTKIACHFQIPPPSDENFTNTIYSVCFSPDGRNILVAVGDRIFFYNAKTLEYEDSVRGHKSDVYCVAFSKDGLRFASGSADKTVVIWSISKEGLLRYNHKDPIQFLAYNPVLNSLISVTDGDFGLWTLDQSNVVKHDLPSKGLCADWSPDGQLLAIGCFNGTVLLRDKNGGKLAELMKSVSPIWTVQFCPKKFDTTDNTLAIGSWDEKLSIYSIAGGKSFNQIGLDKKLGFDPLSISFFSGGHYMVIGGTNKKLTLWNKEGVKLGEIGEMNDWIFSCSVQSETNKVLGSTNQGELKIHDVEFKTVHGLYNERYAHRDLMTDIIIQHLVSETRVKIRCRDYIRRISIYKDRLAVQLPEKLIIYTVNPEDPLDMKYKAYRKISKKLECEDLLVLEHHIILYKGKTLQLLNFSGVIEREWIMDSEIGYSKVIGGPPKKEGLIVGLKDGSIFKVFVDNAFPILLIKQSTAIKSVDINANREKVAVVDEFNNLFIYDSISKKLLHQETNVESVSWNLEMDEMLAYTGDGQLYIKTGDLSPSSQRMPGEVVGFKGSKIFTLFDGSMTAIDVPQSGTFYQYLQKDFKMAYKIACLGVTEQDWRSLGIEALKANDFDMSKRAFARIRDLKFLDLCEKSENAHRRKDLNKFELEGEILCYLGKFKEASLLLCKNNLAKKAINMYTLLRKFKEAKEVAQKYGQGDIMDDEMILNQARDEEDNGNWKESASLYIKCKHFKEAIDVYGKKGVLDSILNILKILDKDKHNEEIHLCARYFKEMDNHTYAKQALLKLGDIKGLMALHIEFHQWDEALNQLKTHPQFADKVYLPYADWLAANDKFEEAQAAYKKAKKPDLALRIIEFLTKNAVIEKRFKDAAKYLFILACEYLRMVEDAVHPSPEDLKNLKRFEENSKKAEIYHAYDHVHKLIEDPYHSMVHGSLINETIFNSSRFLVNTISSQSLQGINKVYIYYALSLLGSKFEAFRTARFGYEKLQTLKISPEWQEEIDLAALKIRCKPFSDKEQYQPICNRCMNVNALINQNGDHCTACGHPFIRNFVGFDTLPLVEFVPEARIPLPNVLELLKEEPDESVSTPSSRPSQRTKPETDGWKENIYGEEQTLTFNQQNNEEDNDLFTQRMLEWLETQVTADSYRPVEVNEEILRSLRFSEVFMIDLRHICKSYPIRFFRNVIPDISIGLCDNSGKFYLQDEYEFANIEGNEWPFAKVGI
ncbi:unnamed protein product [Moneuplotes crassus]|uniref:Intraflagellar transport protein 122 homolog n=1 Tax=Euplotes crassus TaxID=5936 RepID=A0AAD1UTD5_EUPCR|nr:unnamed protein product [Moneuplotes crassus]